MKYVVFLGDGMADLPLPQYDNKTPLMIANKPNMDKIAAGLAGMVKTVPDELAPGSDTANMSVMGFDPVKYYSGRSPLEAVSMGIELQNDDIAFRCNLVTLSEPDANGSITMLDYSSDEISSEEAAVLINDLNKELSTDLISFHAGKSYRHCIVWHGGPLDMKLIPPHDILTQKIDAYLPSGNGSDLLMDLMMRSRDILADHPINRDRIRRGLNPASSIWIWGQGTKPQLPLISDMYGIKGAVISAVDLIFGLGICAGMELIEVEGATGNIHTNFTGKAQAAIDAFKRGQDYIYLHLEAPDECGHRAETENKIRSIELLDSYIIGPVWQYLEDSRKMTGEDYRIMVLPDHPTPLSLRTHTSDPVPFAIYSSDNSLNRPAKAYDEQACSKTGILIDPGHELFGMFIRGEF
ncbi:MAG: cofactor-independent phosphoglycerate mutase [Clostridiaceae bacterium]|nr:cofactor-independent phosphoglycerate mutase [Clostridiaceae bacterium]